MSDLVNYVKDVEKANTNSWCEEFCYNKLTNRISIHSRNIKIILAMVVIFLISKCNKDLREEFLSTFEEYDKLKNN